HQPWLAAGPSRFDEPIEYELCREPSGRFVGQGIDEGVGATVCEGLHEGIGDTDRQIEIRHLGRRLLESDEIQDVRVVDPEDAHICASPGSTLFNNIRGKVKEAHEGNGPGGYAAGRCDSVIVRTEVTKRKSRAAARLVNERLMFQTVINGGEGVFDREDEAGGELLEATSGIHQCGRIGKKVETGHALVPA